MSGEHGNWSLLCFVRKTKTKIKTKQKQKTGAWPWRHSMRTALALCALEVQGLAADVYSSGLTQPKAVAPRKWWPADSPTQESPNTDGLGVIHVKGQEGVRPISDRQTDRERSHKYIILANFQLFLYTHDWRQRPKVPSFPPLVNPLPHYCTPADEPARQVWGWIRAHLLQTCGANSLLVFGQMEQPWVGEGSSQTLKPRLPSGRGRASASPAHLCCMCVFPLPNKCLSSPVDSVCCVRDLSLLHLLHWSLPAFKFSHWQRKHTHPRPQTVAHVPPMEQKSTTLVHRKFQPSLTAFPFSGPSYYTSVLVSQYLTLFSI